MSMQVVGILARVDVLTRSQVLTRLNGISGVSTFAVDDEQRVGIVIEGESIDDAHQILTEQVAKVDGVLGTWPVYSHMDSESAPSESGLSCR